MKFWTVEKFLCYFSNHLNYTQSFKNDTSHENWTPISIFISICLGPDCDVNWTSMTKNSTRRTNFIEDWNSGSRFSVTALFATYWQKSRENNKLVPYCHNVIYWGKYRKIYVGGGITTRGFSLFRLVQSRWYVHDFMQVLCNH